MMKLTTKQVEALKGLSADQYRPRTADDRTMFALARRGLVETCLLDRTLWVRGWKLTSIGVESGYETHSNTEEA